MSGNEVNKKRYIITGGTGLIGAHLAAELIKDGHEVILLSRRPERAQGVPSGARLERWDATTAAGWAHLVDGAEAIINLAGESLSGSGFFPTRWSEDRRRRIRGSRLKAGQAVVEAIESVENKPRAVIQSSAIGYYGSSGDKILTEESPQGDGFLADLCVDWEASTAPVEGVGVRRTVIRIGIVLTADGGALPRLLLPFKLFAGGPMGNGRQWYSWIHLEDVVRSIRFLLEEETAEGPFNLTAPTPVRNAQLGRAIGRVLHRPYLLPVPGFVLRTLFGEVSSVVLEGQRVHPDRLESAGFNFTHPDVEPALRDLLS